MRGAQNGRSGIPQYNPVQPSYSYTRAGFFPLSLTLFHVCIPSFTYCIFIYNYPCISQYISCQGDFSMFPLFSSFFSSFNSTRLLKTLEHVEQRHPRGHRRAPHVSARRSTSRSCTRRTTPPGSRRGPRRGGGGARGGRATRRTARARSPSSCLGPRTFATS